MCSSQNLAAMSIDWENVIDSLLKFICLYLNDKGILRNSSYLEDLCEDYIDLPDNSTNDTVEPLPPVVELPQSLRDALTVLHVIVFATSLLGNIVVLLLIVTNKSIRFATSTFIVSLTISNLMVTVFAIPTQMAIISSPTLDFYSNENTGSFTCKIMTYMESVAMTANILTLVCLSIERYLAVLHPLKARSMKPTARTFGLLTMVWGVAIVFSIPDALIYNYVAVYDSITIWWPDTTSTQMMKPHIVSQSTIQICDKNALECYQLNPRHPANQRHLSRFADDNHQERYKCRVSENYYKELLVYRWAQLVILLFLPIAIMTFTYVRIGCRLWARKQTGQQQDGGSGLRVRTAKRVILMLTVAISLFIICWAPMIIFRVITITTTLAITSDLLILHYFFNWLAISNCCHNPLVYTLLHQKFRKCITDVVLCRRPNKVQPQGIAVAAASATLTPSTYKEGGLDGKSTISFRQSIRHLREKSSTSPPLIKYPLITINMKASNV